MVLFSFIYLYSFRLTSIPFLLKKRDAECLWDRGGNNLLSFIYACELGQTIVITYTNTKPSCMFIVLYLTVYKRFLHTLFFTAALQMVKLGLWELEIFELLEAGLETENFNSELSSPCVPYPIMCESFYTCMCFYMYTHMLTSLPF